MPKIEFKRGTKDKLPTLAVGEPAFTTDTKEFFIGSDEGNIEFAKQSDLESTNANVANKAEQTALDATNAQVTNNTNTLNNLANVNANAEVLSARGTFPLLGNRLDNVDASLAEMAKYINVKKYGAKGDGVTDDTTAIKNAITDATSTKIPLYFPTGTYLITDNIVIPDSGTTNVIGDGKETTFLLFDLSSGYALETQSYYARSVQIKDLTLQLKNINNDVGGLKVTTPSVWGSGCSLINVNITDFSTICLELVETFNSYFENCKFTGAVRSGVKVAKIIKFSKVSSFGSVVNFQNCVIHMGKIGVQNNGGTAYKFSGCTFESLTLFHQLSQITGLSMFEIFENSWFELIDNGIINADIDESNLTPIVPIANKADITRLNFNNNFISSNVVANFLNSTVEPFYYTDFLVTSGLLKSFQKIPNGLTFTYSNGQDNTVNVEQLINQNIDLSPIAYSPYNAFKSGAIIIVVDVTGLNGAKMNAVFLTSNYQTDVVLQGTVKDPSNVGLSYKIMGVWSDSLTLNIKAYGYGVTDVTVKCNLLVA